MNIYVFEIHFQVQMTCMTLYPEVYSSSVPTELLTRVPTTLLPFSQLIPALDTMPQPFFSSDNFQELKGHSQSPRELQAQTIISVLLISLIEAPKNNLPHVYNSLLMVTSLKKH